MTEQPELPLEFATYDHYTITLAKGAVGDMHVVREHQAKDEEAAITLIEGLRDAAAGRDGVTWQNQEVDTRGLMFGLAAGGVVWEISVVPTFTEGLRAS
jgi:hypothetical protein